MTAARRGRPEPARPATRGSRFIISGGKIIAIDLSADLGRIRRAGLR
jgi:hypothetical protein